jgi:hypothetical protein
VTEDWGELTIERVVAAVEESTKEYHAPRGSSIWIPRLYVSVDAILEALWPKVPRSYRLERTDEVRTLLTKAARQGLIHREKVTSRWHYTSKRVREEIETEWGLTLDQRAERTTAFFRREIERDLAEAPEKPWRWPTDGRGWFHDGLTYAVELGLLVGVDVKGLGRRYLTPDYIERYEAAVDVERRVTDALDARVAEVQRFLNEIAPPVNDRRERQITITLSQAERLRELLEAVNAT